jgi:uncharacterized membrane protein
MRKLWYLLMKGLAALLPIGLTIYIVIKLGTWVESLLREIITLVLPEQYYRPGLGLVVGFALLLTAGLLVNAYLMRWFLDAWEQFLGRIPLIKTVYAALRDLVKFLPGDNKRAPRRVVVVSFGTARAIGFVTREATPELKTIAAGEDIVAVYFPMSYQLGGFTLYLPRERIAPLDMGVEEAMRLVLTGGMSFTRD